MFLAASVLEECFSFSYLVGYRRMFFQVANKLGIMLHHIVLCHIISWTPMI